mmetsp:Transcript_1409/g.1891  ORF Transcript_1409/g.1891 Transcript_1409/m.1891 type:complete len:86 (-) Transcript_1409:423-680(-)|eukprot:CAMPEP_0170492508 /NCGR_PEP_ID=MMETSP0208-20121228/12360_1 /TAXON_ID=197538 /ORGANISM="Strombidium inclinatum, Strain S3" /LENGTH=85 /DNA_ID=CAMNT_0010768259 /DNA_START=660 /DNA_END=917 /DNA_ORIENTATION=-
MLFVNSVQGVALIDWANRWPLIPAFFLGLAALIASYMMSIVNLLLHVNRGSTLIEAKFILPRGSTDQKKALNLMAKKQRRISNHI